MKSEEVGYGACRHDCDDEESHLEDRVEGDNVREDHGDPLFCIGIWRVIGQVLPSPLHKLLVFRVFLGLHGVAASPLIGLYDLVLVSVVTPFSRNSFVILPFQRDSVTNLPCRAA